MKGPLHLATAALALMALVPVQSAQAACIDNATASAARLHEFETMMMVVSLRCTRIGVNMRPEFDGMVEAHQAPFGQATTRLRKYLGGNGFDVHSGQFDRYATIVANKYGGGRTSVDNCQMLDQVVGELAKVPDLAVLAMVAEQMVGRPTLDAMACVVQP